MSGRRRSARTPSRRSPTPSSRWFTERYPDTARWREQLASTPSEGYARACEAIADTDLRSDIARIKVPTTVILGLHDPVVGDENRRFLGEVGRMVALDAAHLANVERPEAFSEAVLAA